MMPTSANFPGRWKTDSCRICGKFDTDQHLFICPGFIDLTTEIKYSMFLDEKTLCDEAKIVPLARKASLIRERLEEIKDKLREVDVPGM